MTPPVLPVLDIRGLNKLFGRVAAAQDITVSVGAEEVVSIIGANGAGKTTFVNMITGYTRPTSGVIRFRGHDLIGLPPRAVTRLGVCRSFQVPQVFGTLSVLENLMIADGLAEPGRTALSTLATPARRASCEALLATYQIADYRDRPAAVVPQGVRKLLDIAMATARPATLLLLDEPTSGISTEEKFPMMDVVMAALARRQATVIFIEHDIDIVERYGTRVLAFHEGRILADGPPGAVLVDPKIREHVTGRRAGRAEGAAPTVPAAGGPGRA
jgi:branched-chain amino acid transport system ATP-binding protein